MGLMCFAQPQRQPNTPVEDGVISTIAAKAIAKSATQFEAAVEKHTTNRLIIMYFDESHTLFDDPLGDGASRYAALCKALDCLYKTNIFSLFLSTSSNISRFAPPMGDAFSARTSRVDGLQPPITELPFDCHYSFPISPAHYTLEMSGELSFMCRFGRPLCVHPRVIMHVTRPL